ncbi:MAG: SusC/RagA family TonB-linked outer membrane protein [Bacteroidetes bacterium]|nr:SusC/RagA family TonB-linked outer membrane protein [Bacteroidota bacterium]
MKKTALSVMLFMLLCIGSNVAFAQQKTVSGTVKDETGQGLPGATVTEKGTSNQVLTNNGGSFTIKVKPGATLVISYIGFTPKEIAAEDRTMAVTLESGSTKALNEVVVTSLGISKQQRAIGYAQSTIKADQITKTATTNFATALYGKAPGVQVAAAPGGSTAGVYVQIRGLNSINFRTTPLIIMDGIPIRDGDFNSGNYWGDGRVRSNGAVDLNPEDIENITVLKGAAAAALYGSEGTNGVLVVTTKKGKSKGFAVDFSANYSQDKVAYLPRLQNVRGTGFPVPWGVYSSDENGFGHYTLNGTDYRTMVSGSLNFGPKFDGQPILAWDGVVRPYSAQTDRYASLFQTANNATQNIALTNVTDITNTRIALTHRHTEGVSLGNKNDRVTASINSTIKVGKKYTVDVMINYMNDHIHNRPFLIDRLVNNFTGMMPVFDNGDWYRAKYQTSLGYKYVTGSNQSATPDENLKIPNTRTDLLDYMWNVNKNQTDEYNNRLISSITNTWQILNNLTLRGRLSTDLTFNRTLSKSFSSQPIAFGPSGSYGINTFNYNIFYGDVLLTYNKQITSDLGLTAMGGYTADKESSYTTNISTNGGLSTENWFDLAASYNSTLNAGSVQTYLTKDAFLGTLNLNFRNYLYVEGTVRRDRTSTMYPTNNSFVYPSANAGFILSDAFKLPSAINYAKLRASWGIVGNYPPAYTANVAYNAANYGVQAPGTNPVLATTTQSPFGNNFIKPEQKHELEFGLETRLLKNRAKFDVAYYEAKVVDQILSLSIPASSGATGILTNIGTLKNRGIEITLGGTPVLTKDFVWDITLNFSTNTNRILKLTTGSNELLHGDYDGNAWQLKSLVGRPIGDIYSHPVLKNDKGENIISSDGLYQADPNKMQSYGNVQAKGIGGIINSFTYKGFTLDVNLDFKYGGYVIPTGLYWMTSRGVTKESLNYMDTEHGGLTYYLDKNSGKGVQTTAAQGPNGEVVMHDGMLLDGVTADGAKNTNVVSQAYYYWVTYNWGGPQYSPTTLYNLYIHRNDYLKMREIALTYNIAPKLAGKVFAKKLSVSVFGRNLFYIYRSIKDMDAEQLTTGNYWLNNISNAGSQPATRTWGVMLRATF